MKNLLDRYRQGDRRALSRLISIVENEDERSDEILDKIFPLVGKALRLGITGPPGAGKSTLVDQICKKYRSRDKKVGIIAVDPTSIFSGGALLGDRIRMNDLATDSGIFIRSMATRGSFGGLAWRSQEVADLLDGFGFDVIIFETVGVGQSELDIAEAADTTIVVLVPESGDAIQTMKAGLMEIADIFVLNKSDREGTDRLKIEIENALNLKKNDKPWKIPVVQTIASTGAGIDDLMDKIEQHGRFDIKTELRQEKRKKRLERLMRQRIGELLQEKFWDIERNKMLDEQLNLILNGKSSPYRASRELVQNFLKKVNH